MTYIFIYVNNRVQSIEFYLYTIDICCGAENKKIKNDFNQLMSFLIR